MSPHQRVLTFAASTVKSRLIRSARAAAAGSAMVVVLNRLGVLPHKPCSCMIRATRLRPCRRPSPTRSSWIFGAP
jgi:hypothetical protein